MTTEARRADLFCASFLADSHSGHVDAALNDDADVLERSPAERFELTVDLLLVLLCERETFDPGSQTD